MKRMLRAMMMLPIVGQVDSLLQLDNFIRAQDSPTYTTLQLHLFSPCSLSLSSFCLPFFSSVTCHSACAWLIIYLCALLLLLFFVSLSFGGRRGRQKWQAYKARAGCLAQRELKCHPELEGGEVLPQTDWAVLLPLLLKVSLLPLSMLFV